ncbi:E3 ubiquitin-protein ligase RNF126 isoform X1 [Strix aluco]|uniref:E3 ubiquitin-protein ligase RNF126 isoform X1 n=1 Tax=Strix aluco TaxID=111821 RepID=UPI003DA56AE4
MGTNPGRLWAASAAAPSCSSSLFLLPEGPAGARGGLGGAGAPEPAPRGNGGAARPGHPEPRPCKSRPPRAPPLLFRVSAASRFLSPLGRRRLRRASLGGVRRGGGGVGRWRRLHRSRDGSSATAARPRSPRACPNADNETSSSTSASDQSRHPFENVDQHLFTLPQGYGQFAFGIFDDSFEFPFGSNVQSEDNRDLENRREREHQSRHRYGARQPRARLATRRAAGRHEGVPTLEGIIQQLVNGIIAPTTIPNLGLGPWGVLHSNPMDYAWGANGLDAIITQLLNQFENTGPPPADKEKIQALPTVQIAQEHVDSGLECPVCKEDYTVGENVRQLPCNHLFHNSCIVPWLEQHDTCPVCRKSLSGQNTATNPPGLTGMNFSPSSSSSSSSSSSPSNENSSNNS